MFYRLYIWHSELRIISFSVVNMTEKSQSFLPFKRFENYPNFKCQFLEFYNMIFNSLFLQESFPFIKNSCKERRKKIFFFLWVDMVGTNHDKVLTQWRHMPMGQFRANIFLMRITSTYFWASEVFKNQHF